MSSLAGDEYYTKPRRTPSWRERLARFLRRDRRNRNKVLPVSKAPPRLGPIGEDVLAFDTTKSLIGDFSSLKFDTSSSKDFTLSFDVPSTKSFAPTLTSPNTLDRRPIKSQPTESSSPPPAIHLPSFDKNDSSLLDSWLQQAGQTSQTVKVDTTATSEPQPKKYQSIFNQEQTTSIPVVSEPAPSTNQNSSPAKRRLDEPDLGYSKTRTNVLPVTNSPPIDQISLGSSTTQPASTYTSATNRYSADLSTETSFASKHSTSNASKRLSTGSTYSRSYGSKPDAETESIISTTSTNTAARRFEVKTSSLLTGKSSADNTAISNTISRINNNSFTGVSTGTPRNSTLVETGGKKSVTDSIKALNKPDDKNPSRRVSQPAIRSSWTERSDKEPNSRNPSRTPTPEGNDGLSRVRRSSSRMSDRMSWINNLEDNKSSGRDYSLKKIETGGVAAKLAAFENKKDTASPSTATETPKFGRSRANSNSSKTAPSELYSIEGAKLVKRSTAEEKAPGSVTDVVGEGFKKKLEGLTGKKVEQQAKKDDKNSVNMIRGPAALAEAKKQVPQDVLDMIELTGADEEVAINDYLKKGHLGHTKTWNDEEIKKDLSEAKNQKLFAEEKKVSNPSSPIVQEKSTPAHLNTDKEIREEKAEEVQKVETPVTITSEPTKPVISVSLVDVSNAINTSNTTTKEAFNPASLPQFA